MLTVLGRREDRSHFCCEFFKQYRRLLVRRCLVLPSTVGLAVVGIECRFPDSGAYPVQPLSVAVRLFGRQDLSLPESVEVAFAVAWRLKEVRIVWLPASQACDHASGHSPSRLVTQFLATFASEKRRMLGKPNRAFMTASIVTGGSKAPSFVSVVDSL